MKTIICSNKQKLGQRAAARGAELIRTAVAERGHARIIVATGASQFATLAALVHVPNVDWNRVTAFHLDEYLGLPLMHPASFRLFLWTRFVSQLPMPLAAFHYVDGTAVEPEAECRRLGGLIRQQSIDVAFVGIGENGHLAFNDPPADFRTTKPYCIVNLDTACRRQQQGEGWFSSLRAVPRRAISMSCQQILQARAIICSVPDQRKARAVRDALQGPVTPTVPASILQHHPKVELYLDQSSTSLLRQR